MHKHAHKMFGEHEKSVRVAGGAVECNFIFLSLLQAFLKYFITQLQVEMAKRS